MDKEQSVNPGLVICPPPIPVDDCMRHLGVDFTCMAVISSENAAKQAFPSRWIRSKICDGCKRNPPTNKQQQFNNLL